MPVAGMTRLLKVAWPVEVVDTTVVPVMLLFPKLMVIGIPVSGLPVAVVSDTVTGLRAMPAEPVLGWLTNANRLLAAVTVNVFEVPLAGLSVAVSWNEPGVEAVKPVKIASPLLPVLAVVVPPSCPSIIPTVTGLPMITFPSASVTLTVITPRLAPTATLLLGCVMKLTDAGSAAIVNGLDVAPCNPVDDAVSE